MKKQKQVPSHRKQLAFELGECSGRAAHGASIAVARAADAKVEETPSNVICLRSEIVQQEQTERGIYYANIMALTKHLV